ncbi:unnamed protein product (macronuclear) [Paramecium tetraurelia]|uniref:Uncharacterized protein n=1 Tax=Paramecium tetraurelia TaxID=5888 RepID=A0BM46_PARTE|nr:uncharacterized protein GSPATT00030247001 [Paramecium tetraurelia]CAK59613.1 unnamed protein product [Paramecium tetraurelia]|eukprot:XP_001427011.1 hypothetical protein (macronuclear) [Paramecium tetraurelia strain d4-2]
MNQTLQYVESSQSDMYNESEFDEHQRGINLAFLNQKTLEDKIQFSNLNINQPLDLKAPAETIQEYLFTDEKLEVQGKGLNNTHTSFNKYLNLKLLDLTRCKLHQIPEDIKQIYYTTRRSMVNLQKLYMSSNFLTFVPNFLESLKFLEILDLSFNQLHSLNIHIASLKQLNISSNNFEQPYPYSIDVLCIQMNPISQLPRSFDRVIKNMNQLEFDWFKYCKPPLPLKLNFVKYPSIQQKLMNALKHNKLNFLDFVKLLSVNEQNFSGTDYKERNLFCQAGLNDDIGALHGLYQIIPQDINKTDFDNNTPLTVCYLDGKLRSVSILKSFGATFSVNAIHQISQRADIQNLRFILASHNNQEVLLMHRNMDGNTPLHQLMMNFDKHENSSEFANTILQYGAEPNVENYEGSTPLDVAIKKQQIKAIQFGYQYNQIKRHNIKKGQLFDFNHHSSQNGQSLCHTAMSIGNLEIIEFLLAINSDFFAINKFNKLPRYFATQSLVFIKNTRKVEKRYIYTNILREKSLLEQQEKNVYQMKNQIEKNMVQRHQNMVQKHLDQEEIEDIEDFDEMESYNENSLQVGSECSVRETVAESAPIFQKSSCLNEHSQAIKRNVDFINEFDFQDELPEILKLLRSGNLEVTIQKLKNILQYESLPVSERIKYKNQVNFLKFKFKQKRVELKTQIANDVLLVLNEYQLLNFRSELRHKYLKELQQFLLDQSKLEISKALQIILRQKMICSSFNLNRDLKINNLTQINDLRLRLSSNLIYDINNYASPLFQLQYQMFNWLYSYTRINQLFQFIKL